MTMNRILKSLYCLLIFLLITSCAAGGASQNDTNYEEHFYPNNSNNSIEVDDSYKTDNNTALNILMASAYNDNDHYEFWQSLIEKSDHFFSQYENLSKFNTSNRLKITLPKNLDAVITLLDENNNPEYISIPTNNGICYLYAEEKLDKYKINVQYYNNNQIISEDFIVTNDYNLEINGDSKNNDIIDLMFVIDTTCTMTSELEYIKSEIDQIINQVKEDNANTIVNIAIMLYRDIGASYVTLYSDFTTDVNFQKDFLKNKYANEGGDHEEALDLAYAEVLMKKWSKSSTKILIHIADAPAHDKDLTSWYYSIKKMSEKGIRIISVASSSIDKKTEYLFRSQALLTSGTYVFLSNNSNNETNIDDSTLEEQPVVEYFNSCLIRLINGYHQGVFLEPIPCS